MNVIAIVLAAGRGSRLNSKIPKPLVKINAQPIINYSLKKLEEYPGIKEIIVVASHSNKETISRQILKKFKKVKEIVIGGERRQDSVANALALVDGSVDLVLIHDSARPFIDKKTLASVIAEAGISGAAILAVPVKATIKEVRIVHSPLSMVHGKLCVKRTLDRNMLWEVQTPQVFKRDLLVRAYKKFGRIDVTDDAMLIEKLGAKVSVVKGSYNNIKITTPEDLVFAKAILSGC